MVVRADIDINLNYHSKVGNKLHKSVQLGDFYVAFFCIFDYNSIAQCIMYTKNTRGENERHNNKSLCKSELVIRYNR